MANSAIGPTPNFSGHSSSEAGDMKFHLQNLLDSKERQLQLAGTLGTRVLAQQMELEERVRQLQLQETDAGKDEDDELDAEATERYRELVETIRTWDAENAQLSSGFGYKVSIKCIISASFGPLRLGICSGMALVKVVASCAGPLYCGVLMTSVLTYSGVD